MANLSGLGLSQQGKVFVAKAPDSPVRIYAVTGLPGQPRVFIGKTTAIDISGKWYLRRRRR